MTNLLKLLFYDLVHLFSKNTFRFLVSILLWTAFRFLVSISFWMAFLFWLALSLIEEDLISLYFCFWVSISKKEFHFLLSNLIVSYLVGCVLVSHHYVILAVSDALFISRIISLNEFVVMSDEVENLQHEMRDLVVCF